MGEAWFLLAGSTIGVGGIVQGCEIAGIIRAEWRQGPAWEVAVAALMAAAWWSAGALLIAAVWLDVAGVLP